jgi:hypothetical protein
MNRLLNILLFVNQKNTLNLEIEKGFRLLGRVLTLGKSGNQSEVDFSLPNSQVSVTHCINQLPETIKPDVIVVTSEMVNQLTEWPSTIPKIYIGEDTLNANSIPSLTSIVQISDLEKSSGNTINIPIQNGELSTSVLSECIKICFGQAQNKSFNEFKALIKIAQATTPKERSFVIPILNESPSSPYNINTLLNDLENIEGETICVFNSKEMADKYVSHPRVNKYALLSENVGVGRAWNIGLMMATQATVFILNSDLHLNQNGVNQLEKALHSNERITIVGPCGGFNDFENLKDLHYLENKKLAGPSLVDQISGFYFAVKRKHFSDYSLQFFPEYIPCYMEEWDLAMQMKSHDLLALRVQIDDYAHEWGGTVNSLEKIDCLGSSYEKSEILNSNRLKFVERWKSSFPKMKTNIFLPS